MRQFNFGKLERRVIGGSRFFAAIAVVGSLAGSLLMFVLGAFSMGAAFAAAVWPPNRGSEIGEPPEGATSAVIAVISGLDLFLIAIVLLYFAYGVHSLFIHPEEPEEKFAVPTWLRVKQIGQLKQVVAEVVIVILFVLFLRVALQAYRDPGLDLTWIQVATMAVLPVSTALLALSLKFVELHPKPRSGKSDMENGRATSSGAADARR